MSLQKIFIEQAVKYSSKPCIIDYDSNQTMTYKDVLIRSLVVAKMIAMDPRFKTEQFLGIVLPDSSVHLIVKLAILMNKGKVPVIINYATGLTRNMDYAKAKCEMKYFISSKLLFQRLNVSQPEGVIFIEDMMQTAMSVMKEMNQAGTSDLSVDGLKDKINIGNDDDVAVMLFTSGSEKEPKAVPLTHRNIITNISDMQERLKLPDTYVFASILPYFHVFGMTTSLWLPIYVGAMNVCHPNPLSIQTVVDSLSKYKVTALLGIPSFFHAYFSKAKKEDFASLEILIAGGDKLPQQIVTNYETHFGKTIYEGYGATELSPVVCLNSPGQNKKGSIGTKLKSVQVKVLEIESDKEVPVGAQGRLVVKGDSVMKGYYKDPEKTAAVLKDGWYDTGDIVSIDEDGFIFFKGRFKRFVKIAGEMISLMFIESIVSKYLPHDTKFCVVPKEHPVKGCQLILVTDIEVDFEKIRSELLKELKPIMIPKFLHVVDTMPLSGVGKIDYKTVEKEVLSLEL